MVSKLSLLIKSNIAKSKRRIAVVSLLCILASLLLNIVFVLTFNYSDNFYNCKASLNAPDISYHYLDISKSVEKDELTSFIKEDENVQDVDVVEPLYTYGESEFGDGAIIKIFSFYSENNYKDNKIDRFEILESDESITSGIYLSYIYKSAHNYDVGGKIKLILSNVEYEYTIKGFYNSITTGTINCMDVSYILTNDIYDDLSTKLITAYRVSIICKDGVDIDFATRAISKRISEKYPNLYLSHNQTIETIYKSRYSNAKMFQTILLVGSILIIVTLLAMIAIVLSNYVRSNIANLGVLKATGYTSRSLIIPIIIEFAIILAIASIIGVGGSYIVLPFINGALEAQIGIPYLVRFIPLNAILTVLIILILGTLAVFLSISKITRIEPLNAIKTRKINKNTNNIATLDKTKLGLNTAIGLKSCLSKPSRNIIVSGCFLMVSFLIGLSCFLYTNVIKNADEVISLVCGQVPDSSLSVKLADKDEVLNDLENDPQVDNYYLYTIKKALPSIGKNISLYIVESNKDLNKDRIVVDGRLAENEYEVAINKFYSQDNDLYIGDYLTFEVDDAEIGYEIVGLTQGAYYGGTDGYMLLEGYERIEELTSFTYYVDLKDGLDVDAWNENFRKNSKVSFITNEYKYFSSTASLYKEILVVLCVVIVILSVLISCFVLYILISILLENKRREFGIFKSLGFVTKELIYQVILSVLPFAFVSTVCGTILVKKVTDPIMSSFLNTMGIFRFGREISPFQAVLCIILITVFALGYTALSSLSIRKITPHELFNRE